MKGDCPASNPVPSLAQPPRTRIYATTAAPHYIHMHLALSCDPLANQLTSALLAAAIMTVLNVLSGADPISWNIFLAAMIAMLPALDVGDSKVARGSPVGHSLGFGILIIWVGGLLAILSVSFFGTDKALALQVALALSSGICAHLLAEAATGRTIFTFPRNLKFRTWARESTAQSDRFWSGWGRLGSRGRHLGDSHMNAFSIGLVLACIWVG